VSPHQPCWRTGGDAVSAHTPRLTEEEFRAIGEDPVETHLGAVAAYGLAFQEADRARRSERDLLAALESVKNSLEDTYDGQDLVIDKRLVLTAIAKARGGK
jgi:hypothetical protein